MTSPAANRPLDNLHILVTRPLAQAQPWAKQLTQLGAHVSLQPMLAITPLEDTASRQAIINPILAFADYQKAIFISQNAVHYGLQWLDQYWPQLPVDVQFFAIGQATATLLDQGIGHGDTDASYLAHASTSAMNSEALLAHPDLATVDGEKILIFRGKGGRTLLAEQLMDRGASVDYCELYERQMPTEQQALVSDYRHTSQQAITTVHSGETLDSVCKMMNPNDLQWLQQQPILLPSQRVAVQAKQAGFTHIIVAANACHESMINALSEWQAHGR
jgi:uroporphyrinogen-III synthase